MAILIVGLSFVSVLVEHTNKQNLVFEKKIFMPVFSLSIYFLSNCDDQYGLHVRFLLLLTLYQVCLII